MTIRPKWPMHLLIEHRGFRGIQKSHKNPKLRLFWIKYFANEIVRLYQGVDGRVEGTETIFFLSHNSIPEKRRKEVIYGWIVADY